MEIIKIILSLIFEGLKSFTVYQKEKIEDLEQDLEDKGKENDLLKKDIEIENSNDITNRDDLYNGLS